MLLDQYSAPGAESPPASGSAPAVAPPSASLGDRLKAQLVDALVAFGIFYFIGRLLGARLGGLTDSGFDLHGGPAFLVMSVVGLVLLAYFALAEATVGSTLGKIVAHIRVVDVAGGRLSMRRALIRNLFRFIDGIALYLVGALVIMVTSRRQRLGDIVAGSVVIRGDATGVPRVIALILAALVAVGGVVGGLMIRGGR